MPGFDGTGPRGMGPMTGGGGGFCAVPTGPAWPIHSGMGLRMPHAPWGTMPYYGSPPPFTPGISREEELDYLKGLAQSMTKDLEDIEARIKEVESKEE